jgi:hypothetical protein
MVLVSPPNRVIQGVSCTHERDRVRQGETKQAGRYLPARWELSSWRAADACTLCRLARRAPVRSGGGQETQGSRPDNCPRPVVDPEFAIDVASVALDGVQCEEKPGSDFGIGQPFGNEPKHL